MDSQRKSMIDREIR